MGAPNPVGHPLSDCPRDLLGLRFARVRTGGHQISNRSAVPHQVHDLTASHPVDRPRQSGRILHRQFLGIHTSSVANKSPSGLHRRQPIRVGLLGHPYSRHKVERPATALVQISSGSRQERGAVRRE